MSEVEKVRSEKPVAKCFDYADGRTTQTAYMNGYFVGDTLLDGVYFKCFLDEQGYLEVSVTEDGLKYFKTLNHKYWLGVVLEFAIQNDVFVEKENGYGEELCYVGGEF